jgi:hypothetical protein
MSFRFRRSLKLAPGLRVNLGLRGPSLSVGPRGLGATIGPAGLTTHAGIPGSGLSYRTTTPLRSSRAPVPTSALPANAQHLGGETWKVGVLPSLDEHGRLVLTATDGSPLDPRVERKARTDGAGPLQAWLVAHCAEINGAFDALATLHVGTPRPDADHRLAPEPFASPAPEEPPPPAGSAWDRVFPWRKRAREEAHERNLIVYRHELEQWSASRAIHERDWEARRKRTEDYRQHAPEVMHELLEAALHAVPWPRETNVSFEIGAAGAALAVDVDLPELEHMPTQAAEVAARGLKLNLHERSEAQVRKAYAAHVHGVIFRVVGEAFAALPTLQQVTGSGFTQRADPATGAVRDDYVLSVRMTREAWSRIDFANLAAVDPAAALARFELRSDCGANGRMGAIEPFA